MNECVLKFATSAVQPSEVEGRRVLEVGAFNVNGSVRNILEQYGPAQYVGIDIQPGPGVDVVCDANEVLSRFGAESFDVVVCTELLEHVREWPKVVSNLKQVLRKGGFLLISTRSLGFYYHGYPTDYWRYETGDFEKIFSDFSIERLETDDLAPGVLLKAKKPYDFQMNDLCGYRLYSMITGNRIARLPHWRERLFIVEFALRHATSLVSPRFREKLKRSQFGRGIARQTSRE